MNFPFKIRKPLIYYSSLTPLFLKVQIFLTHNTQNLVVLSWTLFRDQGLNEDHRQAFKKHFFGITGHRYISYYCTIFPFLMEIVFLTHFLKLIYKDFQKPSYY